MSRSGVTGSRPGRTRQVVAVAGAGMLVYIILLVYHVAPYHYNLSSLIKIGASNPFFNPSALEPGLVVFDDPRSGGDGYDGQFFYYTIKDLFMGLRGIANPFRYQRILYPSLAFLLAFGRANLLPFSMLEVNLLAIIFSSVLLWWTIRDTALPGGYILLYMLNIGYLIAVFYDVATPVCVGLIVAASYFFSRRNLWATSAMMALSLLAQENGSVVLAALCLWLALKKQWRGAFTLSTAILPWTAWQVFLWRRYDASPLVMSGNHLRMPFTGMLSQIASLKLPGDWAGNLRELSVYPFMAFVLVLLIVSIHETKKRPSDFMLVLLLHAFVGVCFNREQVWGSTITSPARALAGVFPFLILCYSRERSAGLRILVILSGLLTLMGIVRILLMPSHPFYIT
ncbi:hypothetical protein HZA56_14315 [Candidatus Poribacteria bacterium]|nr:hypothetical protein [Candidatus Poribacteria bacterium]